MPTRIPGPKDGLRPAGRVFGQDAFDMFREWCDVEMSSVMEDLHLQEPLAYI